MVQSGGGEAARLHRSYLTQRGDYSDNLCDYGASFGLPEELPAPDRAFRGDAAHRAAGADAVGWGHPPFEDGFRLDLHAERKDAPADGTTVEERGCPLLHCDGAE